MDIKRLNYLLTGEEEPLFPTEREKTLIQMCLKIINELEASLQNETSQQGPLFNKGQVIQILSDAWVREYKNLNNDPNTGQVNAAGYFLLGFVSSALEEASTGIKNFKSPVRL